MTKIQKIIVLVLSVIAILGGIAWQIAEPGYGPGLFVVGSLIGFISQWWPTRIKSYALRRLKGKAKFNYSNNDGKYTIGSNELVFETAWSKASGESIHIYNDPPSIDSLALAKGVFNIRSVRDVHNLDFTSRTRTPEEGDIVVLKNKYGNYAAIKVLDIQDYSRSDSVDEISFEYVINPDGGGDFK